MINLSITIKQPASEIWEAITNKEQMKEWYFDIQDFELKIGAEFHFYEPGEQKIFLHLCEIKEIIPQKKLAHTWTHPNHSSGSSLLTWELNEYENQTLVTLKHEGIESFADAGKEFTVESYEVGWNELLSELKTKLENKLNKE